MASAIEGTDAYIVEISVSAENDIVVEIDSATGVDLDFCSDVSRRINDTLDRDKEDYSLEVGSSSLSAPFKVVQQYEKHIGDSVDVVTGDNRKLCGVLTAVDAGDGTFTVEVMRKVKEPGEKRPRMVAVAESLKMSECRSVSYHFDFK